MVHRAWAMLPSAVMSWPSALGSSESEPPPARTVGPSLSSDFCSLSLSFGKKVISLDCSSTRT